MRTSADPIAGTRHVHRRENVGISDEGRTGSAPSGLVIDMAVVWYETCRSARGDTGVRVPGGVHRPTSVSYDCSNHNWPHSAVCGPILSPSRSSRHGMGPSSALRPTNSCSLFHVKRIRRHTKAHVCRSLWAEVSACTRSSCKGGRRAFTDPYQANGPALRPRSRTR